MNEESRPWGWAVAAVLLLMLALMPSSQLCRRPGHGHSGGPCRGYQALLRWRCGGGHFGGSHGHRQCEPSQGLRAEGRGTSSPISNATEVDSIEEVSALLQELEGQTMSIRAIREQVGD
mgnify:CR=1 FL=1